MRKYIAVIAAIILMNVGLNAQRTSGLSGTGLDGFIEQTLLDSLHVSRLVLGAAGTVAVSATAVELNYLDISSLGTGASEKAVVLDGSGNYTWPGSGILTYDVLNDGTTTLTTTVLKLNYLDVTPGTSGSEKAVVLDASGKIDVIDLTAWKIGGISVTASAANLNAIPVTTATATELDYNAGVTLGTGLADKVMTLDVGDDFTWPATGLLNYWGTQVTSTGAELNYLDLAGGAGTSEANKAVVLDGSAQIDALDITTLTINGAAVDATADEINRIADKTASIVDVTGDAVTITLATHGDRIITLNRAAGITVTLDAATGTGATYTFIIGTSCTSGSYIIQVANGTDVFDGGLALGVDIDGVGATGFTWYALAGDDTFTMPANGVSGGEVGDVIRITDYATGFFLIEAHIQQTGTDATPFSSGV